MNKFKVYIIRNDINNKVYIGSTINDLQYRFDGHARQNKSELDRDMKKYGKDHFAIELIDDSASSIEELDNLENKYIVEYNAIEEGYNDRLACCYSSRRKTTAYQDLSGMKFGRLTVLKESGRGKDGIEWLCYCDCGRLHIVSGHRLRRKSRGIRSCGCAAKEAASALCRASKAPYDTHERLYKVWKGIKKRCYNENDTAYLRYGGRGITVCDAWRNSYPSFREWAYSNGYDENAPYQQCTIDRIDVNGNYEPSNCRWVNATEQNLNQRDTELICYNGKEMTICQWADYLGISRSVFLNRKRRGWDNIKTISTPVGDYEYGSQCKKRVRCVETGHLFESRKDAALFAGVPASNITMAIKKPTRTAGGYHWEDAAF